MSLQCWKCGAALSTLLPMPRSETCPSCRTPLHACRMCRHFDPSRAGQCRELAADPVYEKMRANWCGWFVPRQDAYQGGGAAIATTHRAALDALFGGSPPHATSGSVNAAPNPPASSTPLDTAPLASSPPHIPDDKTPS